MTYTISNMPKKHDEELFHRAVLHSLAYLNIGEEFEIIFESLPRHQEAFVDYEDDEEFAEISIYISKRLSTKFAIRAVFHEMVHVKQYLTGRLESTPDGNRWEGIIYEDAYRSLPWEVEAFELEEEIMKAFVG